MANIDHLPESQYLAGEREAEIDEIRRSPEYSTDGSIVEMRICEIPHLFLKPNQQYVFTIDPTCESCVKAAAAAAGR